MPQLSSDMAGNLSNACLTCFNQRVQKHPWTASPVPGSSFLESDVLKAPPWCHPAIHCALRVQASLSNPKCFVPRSSWKPLILKAPQQIFVLRHIDVSGLFPNFMQYFVIWTQSQTSYVQGLGNFLGNSGNA